MEPWENAECQHEHIALRVEIERVHIPDRRPDPVGSARSGGMSPCDLDHLRNVVECGHVETALCETDRRKTSAATNFEDRGALRQGEVIDPFER